MYTFFNKLNAGVFMGRTYGYIRSLNEAEQEEKQKIQEVIVGIKDLTFKYDDISESEIYYSYENEYVYNNGSLNTKLCYFELMRAMNPESEKWNMTPEEIAAFVNEGTKE